VSLHFHIKVVTPVSDFACLYPFGVLFGSVVRDLFGSSRGQKRVKSEE